MASSNPNDVQDPALKERLLAALKLGGRLEEGKSKDQKLLESVVATCPTGAVVEAAKAALENMDTESTVPIEECVETIEVECGVTWAHVMRLGLSKWARQSAHAANKKADDELAKLENE